MVKNISSCVQALKIGHQNVRLLKNKSYREDWIDVLKGIGILSVVIGHLYPECRWVFMYHMPLFFMLAGYTLNRRIPFKDFVRKKTKRMLLPYISFFVLLAVGQHSFNFGQVLLFVYGGQKLGGVYGVFWFITVLYLSEIGIRYATRHLKSNIVFAASLIIGYALSDTRIWPWNLNVVPMAMAYMCIGLFLKKHLGTMDKMPLYVKWLLLLSMIFVPMIPKELLLDIKYANFGVPMLSFIISVLCVFMLMSLSQMLSARLTSGGVKMICILGICSMEIMYTHQFFHFRFSETLPSFAILVMCIVLPIVFHYFVIKNKYISLLFTGK